MLLPHPGLVATALRARAELEDAERQGVRGDRAHLPRGGPAPLSVRWPTVVKGYLVTFLHIENLTVKTGHRVTFCYSELIFIADRARGGVGLAPGVDELRNQ